MHGSRQSGFAIVFVIATLALLSVLGVTFVGSAAIDQSLARNGILRQRAILAAESGVERALAALQALPAGPLPENWQATIAAEPTPLDGQSGNGVFTTFSLRVTDESGKLNLNDTNAPCQPNDESGRVETIFSILAGLVLEDRGRGDEIGNILFRDPLVGRGAQPGGQFPHWQAVAAALQKAGATNEEIDALAPHLTLHARQDETVLKPGTPVFGQPDADGQFPGVALRDMLGKPIDRWLEFQTRDFELEPRSPVNLNTASRELLQALLEPLQGVYLEEGPAENQSSEHYGWWATGLGDVDPKLNCMGTIRETLPFAPEQAALLAQAMHDRIHGIPNPALLKPKQQPDADEDGIPEPNPFRTWDEFRWFLADGLADRTGILAGPEYVSPVEAFIPESYASAQQWVDPHAAVADPAGVADFSNLWRSRYAAKLFLTVYPFTNTALSKPVTDAWCRNFYAGYVQDMILANFNPNSQLNDWNPDANIHLDIDKAQLLGYTTEGAFEADGTFRIESEGMCMTGTTLLARHSIECVVRLFEPLRLTTQADFLRGWSRDPEFGGLSRFFEPATLPDEADQFWDFAHASPGGERLSLQSYPEPLFDMENAEARIHDSRYDGHLRLATGEYPHVFANRDILTANAHFNGDGLDTDPLYLDGFGYQANFELLRGVSPFYHQDAANRPGYGPLTGARAMAQAPGNLLPDGVYCERGRTPAYRMGNFIQNSANNHAGRQGGLCFWIKPNFHLGVPTRIRRFAAGPSRPGVFAPQSWLSLVYLANPCSDETDGHYKYTGVPASRKMSLRHYTYNAVTGIGTAMPDGIAGGYGLESRNTWCPTRCLAFGMAWQNGAVTAANYRQFLGAMTLSHTLNRDFPTGTMVGRPSSSKQYFMAPHQWTHIRTAWSLIGTGADHHQHMELAINGVTPPAQAETVGGSAIAWERREICNPYLTAQNASVTFTGDFSMEWLRFGELSGDVSAPYPADSTIDELVFSHLSNASINWTDVVWTGRYVGRDLAPAGEAACVAIYKSPELRLPRAANAMRLRSCSWTLYMPRHGITRPTFYSNLSTCLNLYQAVPVNVTDDPDPMITLWGYNGSGFQTPRDQWDPLSVDVRRPDGSWHCGDHGAMDTRMTDPCGSSPANAEALHYAAGDSFAFRCYFHLKEGAAALMESPVLDDVTFTFSHVQARILSWRTGIES